MANLTLEGGLTPLDRDFARTLESRAVGSMLAEYRNFYFSKYGSRNFGPWDEWGDTAYTEFLTNYFLAETLKDREWLDLVNYCLEKAHEAAQEIIRGQLGKFRPDVEMASIGFPMIGELMMSYGQKLNRNDIVQSGLGLVKLFVQHGHVVDGVITGTYMRYFWGETPMPGAGLYWAARIEGNRKYAAMADAMFQLTVKRNQRPDGIWRHWTDSRGHYGVAWSRGTYWPLLSMTQSFKAVEASTSSAAFLRQEAGKIFGGLLKFQDPDRGMWRLVIDEPTTRLESSASSGFVYCYDQLRSLNAVDQKYGAMIDGAFTGLKRFYYGGGIGSNCRGTSTGVGDYYRTRPMGWADKTLFAAGMALRRPDSVNRQ
jgi:hypothetical protein